MKRFFFGACWLPSLAAVCFLIGICFGFLPNAHAQSSSGSYGSVQQVVTYRVSSPGYGSAGSYGSVQSTAYSSSNGRVVRWFPGKKIIKTVWVVSGGRNRVARRNGLPTQWDRRNANVSYVIMPSGSANGTASGATSSCACGCGCPYCNCGTPAASPITCPDGTCPGVKEESTAIPDGSVWIPSYVAKKISSV